jgi:hypothetical protein
MPNLSEILTSAARIESQSVHCRQKVTVGARAGMSKKGAGCVKTPGSFHTGLGLFRGLRSIRSRKDAKNFRVRDRSHFFGDFLHGLGGLQALAERKERVE